MIADDKLYTGAATTPPRDRLGALRWNNADEFHHEKHVRHERMKLEQNGGRNGGTEQCRPEWFRIPSEGVPFVSLVFFVVTSLLHESG